MGCTPQHVITGWTALLSYLLTIRAFTPLTEVPFSSNASLPLLRKSTSDEKLDPEAPF